MCVCVCVGGGSLKRYISSQRVHKLRTRLSWCSMALVVYPFRRRQFESDSHGRIGGGVNV